MTASISVSPSTTHLSSRHQRQYWKGESGGDHPTDDCAASLKTTRRQRQASKPRTGGVEDRVAQSRGKTSSGVSPAPNHSMFHGVLKNPLLQLIRNQVICLGVRMVVESRDPESFFRTVVFETID
jgi:hypothetical protein